MAFTSGLHLSLFWDRSVQSIPPHPTSWSVLILSSHLWLGLQNGLFPSGFPTKTLVYLSSPPHTCHMPCPWHSFGFDHPNNIWWGVQIIKLLIIWIFPLPIYLIPFKLNYASSASVLKHSSAYVPPSVWVTKFKTPIQNNRQNYRSVYLNLCILDSSLDDKSFRTNFNLLLISSWMMTNILISVYVSMH